MDDSDGDVVIIGESVVKPRGGVSPHAFGASASSGAASGAAAASSSAAAAASVPAPAAPAKVTQSRSGRVVHQPKPVYAPPVPKPDDSSAAAASSTKKSTKKKPKGGAKSKSRARAGGRGGGFDEYHGQGYTVRDHAWFPDDSFIEYASPTIDHLESMYMAITCEDACQQAGLVMTREMKVDLTSDTIERLKRALSSDHERGEIDKTVLALCESGEVRGCALYQSDKSDVDSIKVVTTRFIRSGEVITIYLGRLVEAYQFHLDYGDRDTYNVSSYDIRAESLPSDYTGPDLMLDTNIVANEAKFIRDARWDDHDISANVQCRIVWNHARGLPFVAMIALGDIDAHAELFVDWGDAAWRAHARQKLHRMAHASYEQHFRLRQLQQMLAARGVQPYADMPRVQMTDDVAFEDFHLAPGEEDESATAKSATPTAAAAASSSSSCTIVVDKIVTAAAAASSSSSSSSSLHPSTPNASKPARTPRLEGVMRRVPPAPDTRGHAPTFVLRNTRHVFDNCGVELMDRCDYSSLSAGARAAWCAAAGKQSAAALKPALRTVLETGRCPKAAVYEVVSLRHPARFYSPPDCPTYALLAREAIEKHEPIGAYVGKVHEATPFHGDYKAEDRIKQVYAYDMPSDLFDGIRADTNATSQKNANAAAAHSPVALPDLICESLSIGGNETRFVNDRWCRIGGERSKNAEALPTFDPLHGNLPVMVIRAVRRIEKGEEIVTDYGETFWCKISTALCMEHHSFQQQAAAQIRDCENQLRRNEAGAAAAAAELPPAPDRWSCYRDLYNQWDVVYSHRPPPVRLDPVAHVDDLAPTMVRRARDAKRDAAQREREKAVRAAQRAAAAAARAEAAQRAPTQPVEARVGARVSARVSHLAKKAAKSEAEERSRKEEAAAATSNKAAKRARTEEETLPSQVRSPRRNQRDNNDSDSDSDVELLSRSPSPSPRNSQSMPLAELDAETDLALAMAATPPSPSPSPSSATPPRSTPRPTKGAAGAAASVSIASLALLRVPAVGDDDVADMPRDRDEHKNAVRGGGLVANDMTPDLLTSASPPASTPHSDISPFTDPAPSLKRPRSPSPPSGPSISPSDRKSQVRPGSHTTSPASKSGGDHSSPHKRAKPAETDLLHDNGPSEESKHYAMLD